MSRSLQPAARLAPGAAAIGLGVLGFTGMPLCAQSVVDSAHNLSVSGPGAIRAAAEIGGRELAGATAPAHGLCLQSVRYDYPD